MDARQPIPYAPIFKLNNDLFYDIFYINAASDTPDEFAKNASAMNPLIVTQKTSHVCKLWNTIILGSPSIWGRCFNLDALRFTASDWHDVVLQRTGDSLLSVTGKEIMQWYSGIDKFLLRVLRQHWPRIRDFDVLLSSSAQDWPFTVARILETFGRPAENLRTFVLQTDSDDSPPTRMTRSQMDRHPTFQLFSNSAPSLVHLSIKTTHLPVHFSANFMLSRNMRHLHLPNHALELTNVELLTAFLQMPLLEEVTITIHKLTIEASSGSYLSRPSLPKLKSFYLSSSDFDIYPALLDSIDPGWDCKFFFKHYIREWNTPTLDQGIWPELKHLRRTAQRYAHYLFDHHKSQFPIVDVTQELYGYRFMYTACQKFLRIDVEVYAEGVRDAMIQGLFHTLSTLELSIPVNRLEFYTPPGFLTTPSRFVQEGVKALSSVTNLIATSNEYFAIGAFKFSGSTDETIFPRLNTLSISSFQSMVKGNVYKAVTPLILDRQRTATPIENVVFLRGRDAKDRETPKKPKVHAFDQFTGLKTIWYENTVQHEYICGSGIKE